MDESSWPLTKNVWFLSFQSYAPKFREHGYDTMGFLAGVTDKVNESLADRTK